MALQIVFEDGSGVAHPAAYARIGKVIIDNPVGGEKNVSLDVCIYASKAARDAGKLPVQGPQGCQVEGVNPDTATMADCYGWLKGQEAFANSEDI